MTDPHDDAALPPEPIRDPFARIEAFLLHPRLLALLGFVMGIVAHVNSERYLRGENAGTHAVLCAGLLVAAVLRQNARASDGRG
jgi:hypothetical protein